MPAPSPDLPIRLARLHRSLPVGELLDPPADPAAGLAEGELDETDRRLLDDAIEGAGFERDSDGLLRRIESLPDVVGPGMVLLVVGLNPSPAAAAAGVGFARPGNRFWPAAAAAGLVSVDRDPFHALEHHGIGFTDLVKRTTRKASEIRADEFRAGLARVDRLCRWLQPAACVMVGLMGWRAAVDRRATAGWHDHTLGSRPVYVMPSTSGLNANSSLDDLTTHLRAAAGRPTD